MPPSVQRSNAKHYKGETTITEITEFEGPHFMPALEGWEKIADHALDWALSTPARPSRPEPCRSSPPPTASSSSTRTGARASPS